MASRLPGWRPAAGSAGSCSGCWLTCRARNCWTIAEHAGDADPHGMQHLLGRASWDTDGVRDDLRDYVTTESGDRDGVLVVRLQADLTILARLASALAAARAIPLAA